MGSWVGRWEGGRVESEVGGRKGGVNLMLQEKNEGDCLGRALV